MSITSTPDSVSPFIRAEASLGLEEADIMTDHHSGRIEEFGCGPADPFGQLFIKLVGHPAPDVVSLETGQFLTVHLFPYIL